MSEHYGIAVNRLRELAKADKEGRCVILPCKDWLEIIFGDQETFYKIDPRDIENPLIEIAVCNEERIAWYGEWETVVIIGTDENGLYTEISPEDIGKTVFLTRESAEETLRRMQNE